MIARYMRLGQICKVFGMSRQTANRYIAEMLECKRYEDAAPELNLESRYFNVLCLADYVLNRERLTNKNMAKFIQAYDPHKTAWTLGMIEGKNANT